MKHTAALSGCRRRFRHRGEHGFALLEILVAFVVLALAMGAVSSGIALAMRSDGRAQSRRFALQLAQSRLEAAGVTESLAPGRREGRTSNDYRWLETVTIVRTGMERSAPAAPPLPNQAPSQAAVVPAAFWVEVTVHAVDGTVVELGALKLGTRQPRAAT